MCLGCFENYVSLLGRLKALRLREKSGFLSVLKDMYCCFPGMNRKTSQVLMTGRRKGFGFTAARARNSSWMQVEIFRNSKP